MMTSKFILCMELQCFNKKQKDRNKKNNNTKKNKENF